MIHGKIAPPLSIRNGMGRGGKISFKICKFFKKFKKLPTLEVLLLNLCSVLASSQPPGRGIGHIRPLVPSLFRVLPPLSKIQKTLRTLTADKSSLAPATSLPSPDEIPLSIRYLATTVSAALLIALEKWLTSKSAAT